MVIAEVFSSSAEDRFWSGGPNEAVKSLRLRSAFSRLVSYCVQASFHYNPFIMRLATAFLLLSSLVSLFAGSAKAQVAEDEVINVHTTCKPNTFWVRGLTYPLRMITRCGVYEYEKLPELPKPPYTVTMATRMLGDSSNLAGVPIPTNAKIKSVGAEPIQLAPGSPIVDTFSLYTIVYDVTEKAPAILPKVQASEVRRASVFQHPEEPRELIVNPYLGGDKDGYRYKLRIKGNRTFVRFREFAFSVFPLAIPLRIRGEIKEDVTQLDGEVERVRVPSKAESSPSIGIYGALYAREHYFRYEEGRKSTVYGTGLQASMGPFMGLSISDVSDGVTTLDGDSTTALFKMATLSVGLGMTYGFPKLNVGVFVGLDYGLTAGWRRWDYQGRPWWGFGISTSSSFGLK